MISGNRLKKKFYLCIVLVLTTACTPPAQPDTSPTTAVSTATRQSTPEQPTSTPISATITPLPTRITPTVYPPQEPAANWLTYIHPDLQVAVQYPPDWQVINPNELSGVEGSLTFSRRAFEGEGPDAVCQLEVNQHELYGTRPQVTLWNNNNGFYGCEIQPSADATDPQTGLILAWYPSEIPSREILEIRVFSDYTRAVENSIKSTVRIPKQVMYVDKLPPECRLNADPPLVTTTNGLQIEKFRLTSDNCYRHTNVEAFAALLPAQASERINQLRTQSADRLSEINAILAPFDFTIHEHVLYQSQTPISGLLQWIGQPVINASQTLLFLPVNEASTYKTYQISKTSFQVAQNEGFYSILGYVPTQVFLGDDLIRLAYDHDYRAGVGYPYGLQVLKNEDLIFEYTVLPPSPAAGPVRGLYNWLDHWLLETADVFIRDGVVLNQQLGYSEMFTWHLLNNQPFYFYRQGARIHLSYNEETLPMTFERVLHEPACCSGGMVNMTVADNGLGFYALQDGFWYYVIIAAGA